MKKFIIQSESNQVQINADCASFDEYTLCFLMGNRLIASFNNWDYWYEIIENPKVEHHEVK